MAKTSEKELARYWYIEKKKSAKETAIMVGVTQKTMGDWIKKGGWHREREARILSPNQRAENIEVIISDLANQRIDLCKELVETKASGDTKRASEIRHEMAGIDDGVAKWNKTLLSIKKDTRTTLTTYLDVMEDIFNDLRNYDEKLYLQTILFQKQHVEKATDKLT